jgi:hypothetical protein
MPGPLLAKSLVRRRLPSPQYQAGVRNTIAIDRDGVLMMLVLRVQFRCTNGATGPVGPLWQTLARIMRRVEVIVNGQDTVVTINGAHLASRAQVEWGGRSLGMDATVVLTNSAVTDYDVTIPLPFFLPKGVRPDDTGLDLRQTQQAILAVTWGDASDLFTTTNSAALSNVSCVVEGHYYVNAPAEQVFLARVLDTQDTPNPASNANMAILQDRGSDLWYRSWHMATLRNNVAVQNIITGDVRLNAGAFVYINRDGQNVLAETIRNYALPFAEYPTADRVYRLDMPFLGQNTTNINASALGGDLFLTLGTTYTSGTEIISISREMMRTLRI